MAKKPLPTRKRSMLLGELDVLLSAGLSFKEALAYMPALKLTGNATPPQALFSARLISVHEKAFLDKALSHGAFKDALHAVAENAFLDHRIKQKLFSHALPLYMLIGMLVAVSSVISFFVLPKLLPLLAARRISLPFLLSLLSLLHASPISFLIITVAAIFGLRELARLFHAHGYSIHVLRYISLFRDYSFLRWLRFYLVFEGRRVPALYAIALATSLALHVPANDLKQTAQKTLYFVPPWLLRHIKLRILPHEVLGVLIERTEKAFEDKLKALHLLDAGLTILVSLFVAGVSLSFAQVMRSLTASLF